MCIFVHIFVVGSETCTYFETVIMTLQGHPRSLTFGTNRKRVCVFLWSSIVILVLSFPVSEILQVFCWEERPHPYFTRILGLFPLDQIADIVALRREDPKLIIRVITFEVVQPICPRSEMEMGHLSWPMTHVTNHTVDPWPTWPMTHGSLHHFILRMGLGEGVAWWYWTTLSVLRAKNRRLKLSLQLR